MFVYCILLDKIVVVNNWCINNNLLKKNNFNEINIKFSTNLTPVDIELIFIKHEVGVLMNYGLGRPNS